MRSPILPHALLRPAPPHPHPHRPDARPAAFARDGVTHAVALIEGVRQPRLDWWAAEGEQDQTYYLVVTAGGLVAELVRDEATGERGGARRPSPATTKCASWWIRDFLGHQGICRRRAALEDRTTARAIRADNGPGVGWNSIASGSGCRQVERVRWSWIRRRRDEDCREGEQDNRAPSGQLMHDGTPGDVMHSVLPESGGQDSPPTARRETAPCVVGGGPPFPLPAAPSRPQEPRPCAAPDARPAALARDGAPHAVASIEGVRQPRLQWWAAEGEQHLAIRGSAAGRRR